MNQIDNLYKLINGDANRDLWLSQIYNSTSLLTVSRTLNNFKTALDAQPNAQKQSFFDQNIAQVKKSISNSL